MRHLRAWLKRLSGLRSNQQREQEFTAELEAHLQLHTDENLRSGMAPEEARRQAILKLGGLEPTRQAYRERGTVPFLETLLQDLRFALRQLRKNPGFTITAVLMLTLGLAASIAIFAFVDAALLKPLPYPNPSTLVDITESQAAFPRADLSYPDYLDWKRLNRSFRSFDIYAGIGYLLDASTGAEPVAGERVTDGFFHTLGIAPILGRDFYSGEDLPSGPRSVILSYSTWQKRYAGRKDIIGQPVTLSGIPYTIVGVLPQSFQFAPRNNAEFWTAFHGDGLCEQRRNCHNLIGIARLREGISIDAARSNLTAIAQQLERLYPDSNRGQGVVIQPLYELVVGNIRPILLILLGGAAMLLLIACVNVSSLLLVRSESRRREIAVRGALGASPARIVRQFVTEGLLLVAISTILGLAIASTALHLILRLIPTDMMVVNMPYLDGLGLNPHVLSFAAVIAVLAPLIFSLTPILRLSFNEMREGLNAGSRGSAGVLWRRIGANLVVFELAVAVVLLVGAGLLGKSFYHLLHVDLNFEPHHLATMQILLPKTESSNDAQMNVARKKLLDRISALPEVVSASTTTMLPVQGNGNTIWLRIAGHGYNGEHNEVNHREISSNYFTTTQTRLIHGRFFTEEDTLAKPRVAIINQRLARQYFPHEDPVGRKIGDTTLSPSSIAEIVGVVEDLRESSLDTPTFPTVYFPDNQEPDSFFNLIIRTRNDEKSLLPTLVATIHQVDPGVGTAGEATMIQRINDSETSYLHRSSAYLVGCFAVLAFLLSTMGLYGVIAYSVSQRTREIGVRMALGAQRASVYQLILKEGARLAVWGISTGIVCSLAVTILLCSMLFGVQSWDIATLAAVAIVLAAASLLASYIPAHRAASINPVEALRAE
jgi:macrolide transport system ATP-binding/permease protein